MFWFSKFRSFNSMKTFILPVIAFAAASSLSAVTPGSVATVTVALTATYTSPGLRVVDPDTKEVSMEYEKVTEKTNASGDVISETTTVKAVMKTERYGNKEILTALLESDQLQGDENIRGWTIVEAFAANDESEDDGPSLYAVKSGRTPVPIPMSAYDVAFAEAFSGSFTSNFVRETETATFSGKYRGAVGVLIGDFNLRGLAAGSYRLVSGKLGSGENAVPYSFEIDGAVTVSGLSGTYGESEEGEDEEDAVLGEGRITIAAARVVDLDAIGIGPR